MDWNGVVRLACVMVGVVAARVDATQPAAPDPASLGSTDSIDWLTFLWIDPKGGSAEAGRAVINFLDAASNVVLTPEPAMSAGSRDVLTAGFEIASSGHAVAIWLAAAADREHPEARRFLGRAWGRDSMDPKLLKQVPERRIGGTGPDNWQEFGPRGAQTHADQAASPLSASSLTEWPAHRTAAAKVNTSSGRVIFELAVNVNAIRQDFGDEFDEGRFRSVLEVLRLSNARVVGLHGVIIPSGKVPLRDPSLPKIGIPDPNPYRGPELLCIIATWSARSEPPGTVRSQLLTTDFWPRRQLGEDPPANASLALAARAPWPVLLSAGLDLYAAGLLPDERVAFDTARDTWRRKGGGDRAGRSGAIDQMATMLSPYLGVSMPGAEANLELNWRIPLRADADSASVSLLLAKVLDPVMLQFEGDPSRSVAHLRGVTSVRWAGLSGELGLHTAKVADSAKDQPTAPSVGDLRGVLRSKAASAK